MTNTLIERIRKRHGIKDGEPVGAFSAFGSGVSADSNRLVRVVANTDDIDLDDEVVIPAGADYKSYFLANGNLFLDHNTEWNAGAATLRSISPMMVAGKQSGWKVNADVRKRPIGDDLLTMIREGGVGASIGFIPLDWGDPTEPEVKAYTRNGKAPESVVRSWKWLELSFTLFPCNIRCRAEQARDVDDGKAAVVERLLTEGRISKKSAELVGFPVRKGAIIQVKLPRSFAA